MARRKIVTTRGNAQTIRITWKTIIGSSAFIKGFGHVKNGKPFDDTIQDLSKQWHYERGRLFGCLYNGQLKQGRTVLSAAIYAFASAYNDKAVL